MAIPLAVSPSQLTPGVFLTVDLLAGAASPGTGVLRVALMAPKSAAGDLTPDTEVRAGGGEATANTAFGVGTQGHLAAKLVYRKFPAAQIDFIAPAVGAGSATLALTLSGSPTSNNVIDLDIMGRTGEVAWLVGDSADDVRDKIIDFINERTDDLFVSAASGGAGVVDVTAKVVGNGGNDVLVQAVLRDPQTASEAIAGAAVLTNLVGGTTDPDFTTAYSSLEGVEYHFILACLSNADATNVATTNNLKRGADFINLFNEGLNSRLQQLIAGVSTTIAAATASSSDSDSINNEVFGQMPTFVAARSLPCEIAAREVGGRLAVESVDPNGSRIGEEFDGIFGAQDVQANTPTLAESEQALGNGVTLISYNAQGAPIVVRSVTTHSKDVAGGADRRLLDVQNTSATYIVARDLRTSVPQEFPQAKIAEDPAAGEDPPPEGVVTPTDIFAFLRTRLRFFQDRAVLTKASVDEAVGANGQEATMIVRINPSDAGQVDMVIPFKIVPLLVKFGEVVQRVPN